MSKQTDNNISIKEYEDEIQRPDNKTLLSKLIKNKEQQTRFKKYKRKTCFLIANRWKKIWRLTIITQVIGLVWFLCLMAYQLFLGYLMPKPFSYKNSSGTI